MLHMPANSAEPHSSGTGPPLKQNCVDCITTPMLSDRRLYNNSQIITVISKIESPDYLPGYDGLLIDV